MYALLPFSSAAEGAAAGASAGDYSAAVSAARLARLARAVRVFKFVQSLPQLQLVFDGFFHSLPSVAYIGLFLALICYVFAVIGVELFKKNDPANFGSLHLSMMALYRAATLEDWTDLMYTNIYGCEHYGDYNGTYFPVENGMAACVDEQFPLLSATYFILFVSITAFLLLNLFIGVITTSMAEAKEHLDIVRAEHAHEAVELKMAAKKRRKELKDAASFEQEEMKNPLEGIEMGAAGGM